MSKVADLTKDNPFYIDNKNYINNLNGEFVIKNNKIFKSNLDGFFPNKEKISLNLNFYYHLNFFLL